MVWAVNPRQKPPTTAVLCCGVTRTVRKGSSSSPTAPILQHPCTSAGTPRDQLVVGVLDSPEGVAVGEDGCGDSVGIEDAFPFAGGPTVVANLFELGRSSSG